MADSSNPIPNPFGAPSNGGSGQSSDGMRLIRELMAKQKANGAKSSKIGVNDASTRLDNMSLKTFDGLFNGLKGQINQLNTLIARGHKKDISDAEMERLTAQLRRAYNAAKILQEKADGRVGTAGNTSQAGNWAIAGEKLEDFIDKAFRTAVRNSGGGYKPPSGGGSGGSGNGRSGSSENGDSGGRGGRGRREKDPDIVALMKQMRDFRKVADSFLAGQKGFTGNPYSLHDTKASKDELARVFSDFMREKQGAISTEDENALLSKFNYAIRRFEIAVREGEKESQGSGRDLGRGFSMLMGTLGVSQLANKMIFNDPMQYRTLPAMQLMASTGPMGQALSSALTTKAQYQNEINQTWFNNGLGMVGAGIAGVTLGGLRGAGAAGSAAAGASRFGRLGKRGLGLAAIGGITSLLGTSGTASKIFDFVAGKFGAVTSDVAFQTDLANQFNKPDLLIERNDLMKNVMRSHGTIGSWNDGGDALGHYTSLKDLEKSRTGNALLDRLSSPYMGTDLTRLGYTGDALGQIMADQGQIIMGKKGAQAESITRFAAGYGAAFGSDPSNILEMLGTAQAAGGKNLQSMVKDNLAAASDQNGQLDQFAINVIAPAVGRVTQSLAVKNVSMNAEKLNEQVSALYREFSQGSLKDSNLGTLITQNPEMLGQMLGSFGQAAQQQAGTDVGFYELMRMGLDPTEFARGAGSSPEMLNKFIEKSYSYFNIKGNMEVGPDGEKRMNWNMFNAIAQILERFGIDRQKAEGLYVLADNNNGKLANLDPSVIRNAASEVNKNASKNLEQISGLDFQQLQGNLAEQQNQFAVTVSGVSGKIKEAQEELNKYITDPAIISKAIAGMDILMGEMKRQIASIRGEEGAEPRYKPATTEGEQSRATVRSLIQRAGGETPEGMNVVKSLIAKQGINWQDTTNGGAQKAEEYLRVNIVEVQNKVNRRMNNPDRVRTPTQAAPGQYGGVFNSYMATAQRNLTNFGGFDNNYATFQSLADRDPKDGKDATITGVSSLVKDYVRQENVAGKAGMMFENGNYNKVIEDVIQRVQKDSKLDPKTRAATLTTLSGIRAKLNNGKTFEGDKRMAQMELLNLLGLGGSSAALNLRQDLAAGIMPSQEKYAEVNAVREYRQLTEGSQYKQFVKSGRDTGNFSLAMDGEGYSVKLSIKKGMSPEQLKQRIQNAIFDQMDATR